ncbi:Hypothetical protein PFR_JS12-3_19 [Propionibacterium freudenreichii]|nr:Hypothetical protein PFR_JS12-3_19 [Propionibacterium freudenreichii]
MLSFCGCASIRGWQLPTIRLVMQCNSAGAPCALTRQLSMDHVQSCEELFVACS